MKVRKHRHKYIDGEMTIKLSNGESYSNIPWKFCEICLKVK